MDGQQVGTTIGPLQRPLLPPHSHHSAWGGGGAGTAPGVELRRELCHLRQQLHHPAVAGRLVACHQRPQHAVGLHVGSCQLAGQALPVLQEVCCIHVARGAHGCLDCQQLLHSTTPRHPRSWSIWLASRQSGLMCHKPRVSMPPPSPRAEAHLVHRAGCRVAVIKKRTQLLVLLLELGHGALLDTVRNVWQRRLHSRGCSHAAACRAAVLEVRQPWALLLLLCCLCRRHGPACWPSSARPLLCAGLLPLLQRLGQSAPQLLQLRAGAGQLAPSRLRRMRGHRPRARSRWSADAVQGRLPYCGRKHAVAACTAGTGLPADAGAAVAAVLAGHGAAGLPACRSAALLAAVCAAGALMACIAICPAAGLCPHICGG